MNKLLIQKQRILYISDNQQYKITSYCHNDFIMLTNLANITQIMLIKKLIH